MFAIPIIIITFIVLIIILLVERKATGAPGKASTSKFLTCTSTKLSRKKFGGDLVGRECKLLLTSLTYFFLSHKLCSLDTLLNFQVLKSNLKNAGDP